MISKEAYILELARNHMVYYSKFLYGKEIVFTPFHMTIYRLLTYFAFGQIKRLIISVPPQHGKSKATSIILPSFMYGLNPNLNIAIASYSFTFAKKFSRAIQNILTSQEYSYVFPKTKLLGTKRSEAGIRTAGEFSISGHDGYFRACGRKTSLTGNPVDVMIYDDLYKDLLEANSPVVREAVIEWFTSVARTRQHNKSQEIMTFTRWHEEDLIGYLMDNEDFKYIHSFDDIDPDFTGWHIVNFEAIKKSEPTEIDDRKTDEVLWPAKHSFKKLNDERVRDPHVFSCLYQGKPTSKEGLLYGSDWKIYSILPEDSKIIKISNYTDTADEGEDNLCSICYIRDKENNIYVIDVIYTDEPMEVTEVLTSKMLVDNGVRQSYIESNNGGKSFARKVQELTSGKVAVNWFNQSRNKEARILTNAANVKDRIYMPEDWKKRWPKFHRDITGYKRIFRANRWHDAPDVLTGIIEKETINQTKVYMLGGRR